MLVGGVDVRIYFVLGLNYCVRTCLVWRTWELLLSLLLIKYMLVGGVIVRIYFALGPKLLRSYVPVRRTWELSNLGFVVVVVRWWW